MPKKQENKFAEILMGCIEENYFKDEFILENHSFMRIISGEMKVIQAKNSYTFSAGDTVLIPRNELATFIKYPKDGKEYKSVLITLNLERLKKFYAKIPAVNLDNTSKQVISFKQNPLLDSFFTSLIPYFEVNSDFPAKLISIKIDEVLTILRSIDKNLDGLLANFSEPEKINLVDFMEKNFMFNMPIEKFAYLTGRSLTTFKRDFKKAFQDTPQKWLTQKRLELAHYQLLQKQRKPNDIYVEVGFENLSHFSFAFKKQFGYPPTKVLNFDS